MMVLCFNTLATEADVSYLALLPHHVGMDVVGVIGSDWVFFGFSYSRVLKRIFNVRTDTLGDGERPQSKQQTNKNRAQRIKNKNISWMEKASR